MKQKQKHENQEQWTGFGALSSHLGCVLVNKLE